MKLPIFITGIQIDNVENCKKVIIIFLFNFRLEFCCYVILW